MELAKDNRSIIIRELDKIRELSLRLSVYDITTTSDRVRGIVASVRRIEEIIK